MNTKNITLSFLLFQGALSAQEALPPPPADQSMWQTIIMIGIALAFFYLILLRPEQKRRKVLDELRDSLKQGDKVVAIGIVGTIGEVNNHTVVLKMIDGSKIEVLKGAVTEVVSEDFGIDKDAATSEK